VLSRPKGLRGGRGLRRELIQRAKMAGAKGQKKKKKNKRERKKFTKNSPVGKKHCF
jgi:hypothetical protein